MFDREQSIAEWRRQMLAAGIKTPVPLEELEIHLREDIEQQMRSGFSEQEAFGSAIKKIGRPRLLKTEFQKADCIGTFMITYRILGVLWMALSGVFGPLFLFVLLHTVFTHPKVLFLPRFYLHTLACLLYLAGGVAGFSLFHYARLIWTKRRTDFATAKSSPASRARAAREGIPFTFPPPPCSSHPCRPTVSRPNSAGRS